MACRMFNRVPVPLFLGIVFILGFFIRILSGSPAVHTDLVYSPGITQKPPGAKTPGDTAVSFYMLLDSGQYEKACDLALEPDFIETGKVASFTERVRPGTFYGWTDKDRFTERMRRELGHGGTGITLKNIRVDSVYAVDFAQYESEHPLKRYPLKRYPLKRHPLKESSLLGLSLQDESLQDSPLQGVPLQDATLQGVEDAYLVDVSGNLLGACTIFRWDKQVLVFRIGKKYKILLSGTKSTKSFFYQSWFSNIKKIGNLRGVQR